MQEMETSYWTQTTNILSINSHQLQCDIELSTPLLNHIDVNEEYIERNETQFIQIRRLRLLATKKQKEPSQKNITEQKDEFRWRLKSPDTDAGQSYQLLESTKHYIITEVSTHVIISRKKAPCFISNASFWIYAKSMRKYAETSWYKKAATTVTLQLRWPTCKLVNTATNQPMTSCR